MIVEEELNKFFASMGTGMKREYVEDENGFNRMILTVQEAIAGDPSLRGRIKVPGGSDISPTESPLRSEMQQAEPRDMTAGEIATEMGTATAGAATGVAAGAVGLPGDFAALLYGGYKALFPNQDETRGQAFVNAVETVSNAAGTEAALNLINSVIPVESMTPELRDAFEQSQTAGTFVGLGKAGKAATAGVKEFIKEAPARVAARQADTSVTLGAGVDPTPMIDKGIVKAQEFLSGKDLQQPSLIALRDKPEIIGTGPKQRLLVEDVARFLENETINRHGRILDPIKNSNDLDLMIEDGIEEVNYQLSKPISGETWYEDDVAEALRLTSRVFPQVAEDEGMRVVSLALSALTSPGTRAGQNQQNSMLVLDELLTSGKMSGKNPTSGKYFGGTRGPNIQKQILLLQHMIDTKGIQGTADFLLSEHTISDLQNLKKDSGLYKTFDVPGAKGDKKLGAFVFGEKVGPFFLNLNGYKDTTADVWFTRSYNRHTGELTRAASKDEALIGGPRNMAERDVMKQWNRGIASAVNKEEQANQAILWYFEQQLYSDLGVKSARSESFADGARKFLQSRGIAEQ